MSNFSSLLASVRGSTSTGAAMGGTLMNVKAAQDYFKLRDLMTSLGDIGGEMGKEFVEMETARGTGQTVGSLLGSIAGFMLSGGSPWGATIGAGVGSYGGGHLATRRDVSDLARQERAAKKKLESFGGTFFGSSRLKEAKSYGRDLERYVSGAKTQLKNRLVKNALTDALYAYAGSQAFLEYDPSGVGKSYGEFIGGKDYVGSDVIGGLKEYSKAAKATKATKAGSAAASAVSPEAFAKTFGKDPESFAVGQRDPFQLTSETGLFNPYLSQRTESPVFSRLLENPVSRSFLPLDYSRTDPFSKRTNEQITNILGLGQVGGAEYMENPWGVSKELGDLLSRWSAGG